jgi:hypothetical protein
VLAGIALHPLRNWSRIVEYMTLTRIFNTKWFVRYMTDGLKAGKVRAVSDAVTRIAAHTASRIEDPNSPLPPWDLMKEWVEGGADSLEKLLSDTGISQQAPPPSDDSLGVAY